MIPEEPYVREWRREYYRTTGRAAQIEKKTAGWYIVEGVQKWRRKNFEAAIATLKERGKFHQTPKLTSSFLSEDYKELLEALTPSLGDNFPTAVHTWCGKLPPFSDIKYWEVWIAEIPNKVFGITGLYQTPETTANTLWLGWLGILPEYRGLGLGKEILENTIAKAAKRNTKTLRAAIPSTDENAQRFFTAAGFSTLGPATPEIIQCGAIREPNSLVFQKDL